MVSGLFAKVFPGFFHGGFRGRFGFLMDFTLDFFLDPFRVFFPCFPRAGAGVGAKWKRVLVLGFGLARRGTQSALFGRGGRPFLGSDVRRGNGSLVGRARSGRAWSQSAFYLGRGR